MRLSHSDLEGALDFVREAGELDGAEPFPSELLCSLASLVRCETAGYCEIDRVRRVTTMCAYTDPDGDGPSDEVYWATVHEHPVRRHRMLTGELGAFKIYDFVSSRQLRRTQFYAEFLGPWNSGGFLMSFCLPAPTGHTRTFTLERDRADFDERERTLCELLRPHLLQLHGTTEARRRARAIVPAAPDGLLTEREAEVLLHVAEGMRNREIAEALWIAPGTVRKHLDNIYAKLGVHSRAAAAAGVQRAGSPSAPDSSSWRF